MNPEVRLLLENYLKPDIGISEASFDQKTGTMDMDDLDSKVTSRTAAVFIENPNYLGDHRARGSQDRGAGQREGG